MTLIPFQQPTGRTKMKSLVQKSNRHNTAAIIAIGATMLVASVLFSATVNKAEAAKGVNNRAPAPRAAALTAQEQINRTGTVRPVEGPQKMSLDRECKGPHVPKRCHRHQH